MKKILISLFVVLFNISILAQSPVKIWTGTHSSTVTSVAFLPNGEVLSAGYDGIAKRWTTDGIETIIYSSPVVYGRRLSIESLATDGNIVAVGLENGLVQVVGGTSWNIGASVLGVSVNNGSVAAVGRTNLVYVDGFPIYSSGGDWNYSVYYSNDGLVWGGTDRYVRTSWGYSYQDSDWILGVDFYNFRVASVGLSANVKVNGHVVYVLPVLGANSVHINRVNNKLILGDWNNNIKVISTGGQFLDGVLEKNFVAPSLVRSIKWSPDGSKFCYGSANGEVVLALPEYTSNPTSTNSPTPPKKGKGRR